MPDRVESGRPQGRGGGRRLSTEQDALEAARLAIVSSGVPHAVTRQITQKHRRASLVEAIARRGSVVDQLGRDFERWIREHYGKHHGKVRGGRRVTVSLAGAGYRSGPRQSVFHELVCLTVDNVFFDGFIMLARFFFFFNVRGHAVLNVYFPPLHFTSCPAFNDLCRCDRLSS